MANNQLEVDARKLVCPMPLLKLKQALNQMVKGDVVLLKASDPTSKRDVLAYAKMAHHKVQLDDMGNEFHFLVTKG